MIGDGSLQSGRVRRQGRRGPTSAMLERLPLSIVEQRCSTGCITGPYNLLDFGLTRLGCNFGVTNLAIGFEASLFEYS